MYRQGTECAHMCQIDDGKGCTGESDYPLHSLSVNGFHFFYNGIGAECFAETPVVLAQLSETGGQVIRRIQQMTVA